MRKVGLNWLGDGINRVDERVVNETHFDGVFRKISITRPDIATYYNYANRRTVQIHGIKRTKLSFNTWESCNFYMEPQTEENNIVLNPDHLIVQKYLEAGCSISKTGLHSQEVKRARDNVLKYYWKHHLQPQDSEDKEIAESPGED